MRKTALILAFALKMVFCSPSACAQAKATIPFTVDHGTIILIVTVNGNQAHMILDTGACATVLDLPAYGNGPLQKASAEGVGRKKTPVGVGKISLQIGQFVLPDVPTLVVSKAVDNADGLLGETALSRFSRVTVDYKANTVTFEIDK